MDRKNLKRFDIYTTTTPVSSKEIADGLFVRNNVSFEQIKVMLHTDTLNVDPDMGLPTVLVHADTEEGNKH